MAGATPAWSESQANVFYGFDFVLTPLAIKWACGGASDVDLANIEMLMAAFPEDAARAGLPEHVRALREISGESYFLAKTLGRNIAPREQQQLCALALPLHIDNVTPEMLEGGVDDEWPGWVVFFQFVESLS